MLSIKREKAGQGPALSATAPEFDQRGIDTSDRPWDLQAVGFANEFTTQLADPTMIPAFLAGGLTYRAIRSGVAGSWVASPAVKSISGLFGRQLGASTLALGGEAAVFTGAHRAALGLTQDWRGATPLPPSLGTEVTGTAIMLASLRSFGFGAGLLGAALQRSGLSGAGTTFALSQAGSYTGLLAAQQAEHRLLYPDQAAIENPYLHAAVSLIHFTGFNHMARHITPRGWQLLENNLEQKTQRLFSDKLQQIQNRLTPQSDAPGLAWQTAGAGDSETFSPGDPKLQGLNFMWGRKTSGTKPPAAPLDPIQFRDQLPNETKTFVGQVDGFLNSIETPFLKTLVQGKITDPDTIGLAARRFQHILEASNPDTAKSTYLHWIIHLGLRRIVDKRDSEALDQLMTMVTRPTPLGSMEGLLAQHLPRTRLPEPLLGISNRYKKKSDYYETIEKMEISEEAKKTLWLLLIAQKKGPDESPYYVNPHDFMNRLGEVHQMYDHAKWMLVQSILEKAPTSPLGLLRLKRLHLILRSELKMESPLDMAEIRGFLGVKLRELENDRYQTSGPLPNPLSETDAEIYLGPQGAFLGEHGPWALLKEMIPQIPELIDPAKEGQRAELRHAVLKDFFAKHPGEAAYSPENIAEVFRMLASALKAPAAHGENKGDFSMQIASAIQNREFQLEALTLGAYEQRFHELRRANAEANGKSYEATPFTHQGFYFGSHKGPATGIKKPVILVVRPHQKEFESQRKFSDGYAEMLSGVVHEATHYFERKRSAGGDWNEGVQIKEEAATFTQEYFWQARHGDANQLRAFVKDSPAGFTVRLLDWVEGNYRKYWDK